MPPKSGRPNSHRIESLNMDKDRYTEPADEKMLRDFSLLMGGAIILFFGLLIPWIRGLAWPYWPWALAAVLALCGLAVPRLLSPVHALWMKFAQGAGWLNSRLILSLLFYLFITPTGWIMRLLGKDPMAREFEAERDSYRVISEDTPRERLEKPF